MRFQEITTHIPHVMQTLYTPNVLQSVTLEEIRDAFRPQQLTDKSWLLQQMVGVDRQSRILVIGSWIGFTSYCLFKMGFINITETDPDQRLEIISKQINRENSYFRHMNCDVNFLNLDYDVIINTSCEHIVNNQWYDNVRTGTRLFLQSTNFKSVDHTNTVDTLDSMVEKYPMQTHYKGQIKHSELFTRFMLCGYK